MGGRGEWAVPVKSIEMEEREAQGKKAENEREGRREEKNNWKLGENIVSI